MTDIKKLRELASKATPGPWLESFTQNGKHTLDPDPKVCFLSTIEALKKTLLICVADYHSEEDIQNFRFIAATNPETVIALIDKVEATESLNSSLYSEIRRLRSQLAEYENDDELEVNHE